MLDDLALDWKWGGWVLGDLADAVRRAGEIVGQGTDVVGVRATPPPTLEAPPTVTLVLATELEVNRLRSEMGHCPYPRGFIEEDGADRWSVQILGFRLEVVAEGGDES